MSRKTTLVLAALTCALASLATLLTLSVHTSTNGVTPTRAALTHCSQADDQERVIDCLNTLLGPYGQQHGLGALNTLMNTLPDDPELRTACHSAGHQLGHDQREHLHTITDIITLHLYACDAALTHGLLDAIAETGISPSQLDALAGACQKEPDTHWCSDGIGHLIWTTTTNFTASVSACERFTLDYPKRTCLEGVLMRMASPQEGTGTRTYTPDEITRMCAGHDNTVQDACSRQLPFAMVYQTLRPLLGDTSSHASLNAGQLGELETGLDKTDRLCQQLDRPWAAECQQQVAGFLYQSQSGMERAAALACSHLERALWTSCAIPPSRRVAGGPPMITQELIVELDALHHT